MRRFGFQEALVSLIPPAVLWSGSALLIFYVMWPYFYYVKAEHLIVLGVFTLWRYTWMGTVYVRAWIYHRFRYPALCRAVATLPPERRYPDHLFVLVTVYREEPWVTAETFQALYRELGCIPSRATVVVASGSDEDDAVVTTVHESHPVRDKVELVLQRQAHGKRIAMGHALRAIARRYEGETDSVTLFMDGDSWLAPGTLERVLPFFCRFPRLGALTTNELAHVRTGSPWYADWFNLKFGQRHVHFQAQALSWKVLTLTGRFSAFRTATVVEEDFIRRIEVDTVEHWRFGRIRFLMGDDKSTWYHLLARGWDMLYLPDVTVHALESRRASFLRVSLALMYRWYGNTLRNNRRALALGPWRIGWFIWYAILEQRLSMWTALVGPVGATLLTLFKSFIYLPFYLGYVLLVRTLQMAAIAFGGHPVSFFTLPLMLYSQWVGALVKIRAWYHLDDQRWAKGRQAQQGEAVGVPLHLRRALGNWSMALAWIAFLVALALAQGVLRLPPPELVVASLTLRG